LLLEKAGREAKKHVGKFSYEKLVRALEDAVKALPARKERKSDKPRLAEAKGHR
jgi:hypothetical protein